MQNIKINNSLDICVIDIEGTIGVAEEWQFENAGDRVATYEKFRECVSQIEALEAERVVVNIRSTGGDVNDALLIYDALKSLSIPITTRCYGYTASAATVIAQAASEGERQISANALYLVHNSTCAAEGNAQDLLSKSELLLKTDESLASLYAERSNRTAEEFTLLMSEEGGNGRWLTSDEAIAAGLADKVIDTTQSDEASAEESDEQNTVKNFWKRIGKRLGIAIEEELPIASHNILHDALQTETAPKQSTPLNALQQVAGPTKLKSIEDPTLHEATPSANERAYSSDVKAFMR